MRAASLYRALLLCYPAAFRHEYGSQMVLMFTEQLHEARRSGNLLQSAALWSHAAIDVFTIAPKEHCHVILQDLRYALRTIASRPAFAAVAILSLALGIGANTAIFSLWNSLLFAPLPGVAHPEQLAILTNPDQFGGWTGTWDATDGPRFWLSYAEFEQLRDQSRSFSGVMAVSSHLFEWQVRLPGSSWEEGSGRFVSGGFFDVLGVSPRIGRLFTAADDHTAAPTAVISYPYWQRRFAGRPDTLGQTVTIGKTALTIIGVAPPSFIGETSGQRPDFWLPLALQPIIERGRDRLHDTPPSKSMWLHVFGRLKPGVTLAQADAESNALFHARLETFYGTSPNRAELLTQHLHLTSAARGASPKRAEFSTSVTALLAAVGVLLLIACANLANLLLARGAARKHEIALRLSLGAGRSRIVRQLLTESLTLAAFGGLAAIAVAYFLHGALVRMIAESDPRFQMAFSFDPLVIAFLAAAVLASALLFGLLPAWQATATAPGASLNARSSGSLAQMRSGRALVSLQLALSLPLLAGAGLLVRSARNLVHADLGFPTQHLLLARVNLVEGAPDPSQRQVLLAGLFRELQRLPGVRSVSFSQLGIFSGGESSNSIQVEGHPARNEQERSSATDVVGPGYFTALGIPLRAGRDIQESDDLAAPKVCLINEAFARRFFDRRNPIGMRLTVVEDNLPRVEYGIVGVAADARTQSLRDAVSPRFFTAAAQDPASALSPTFLIRAASRAPIAAPVRKTIERLDPSLPIETLGTLDDEMAPLTAQDRSTAELAVVFGGVALALAAIGLYGVLSYGVVRRTGEIALRIALGSRPAGVIAMILRETLALVAAGLVIGCVLAVAASNLIHSRLYGIAPSDPFTLTAAALLLLIVAVAAACLPAYRASRLDPMTALRQE